MSQNTSRLLKKHLAKKSRLPMLSVRTGISLLAASSLLFLGILGTWATHYTSQVLGETIVRGNPNVNQVALTFDDGPSPTTDKILEILDHYQVPATFFVVGREIDAYPVQLQHIVLANHELGNHTNTHPQWFLYSPEKIGQELLITEEKIAALTGQRPTIIRAPYGIITPNLHQVVDTLQYRLIGWSVDTEDWKTKPHQATKMAERVIKDTKPGDIILLHDGPAAEDRSATLTALPLLIEGLQQQGYQLVRISELTTFDTEIE